MKSTQFQNIEIKELLGLFHPAEKLEIIELGDTWHPADGYVDESYFRNISTVEEFLNINYDFKGLVLFYAQVNDVIIKYNTDTDKFKLIGDEKIINSIDKKFKSRSEK